MFAFNIIVSIDESSVKLSKTEFEKNLLIVKLTIGIFIVKSFSMIQEQSMINSI